MISLIELLEYVISRYKYIVTVTFLHCSVLCNECLHTYMHNNAKVPTLASSKDNIQHMLCMNKNKDVNVSYFQWNKIWKFV